MTDLPISPNLATMPGGNKPLQGDEAPASGEQAFGAVLARQFAAAGGSTARLGAVLARLGGNAATAGKDTPDTPDTALTASLPPDMLATLLAQHAVSRDVTTPAQSDAGTSAISADPAAAAQQQAPAIPALQPPAVAQASLPARATSQAEQIAAPLAATGGGGTPAPETIAAGTVRANTATSSEFSAVLAASTKPGSEPLTTSGHQPSATRELPADAQFLSAPLQATAGAHVPANVATGAPAHLSVDSAVGQTGWGQEFSQKVTWITTQHDHSAQLRLNPPNLGPLDVTLKISGDQATAVFASPHAAVREAVEQALPKLREMLADNGIMLGNATVNDQAGRNDQGSFTQAPHDRAGPAGPMATDHQTESGTATVVIRRHNGLVDTFA